MTTNLNPLIIYRLSFYNRVKWYNPFTWLGFLIRLIAGIPYNHTAVIYYDQTQKEWFIQEANNKGITSKIWFIANCIKIYDVCAIQKENTNFFYSGQTEYTDCLQTIKNIENSKYDYKGLLLYQLVLNIFKRWVGSNYQDEKYYCYEHVALVFQFSSAYKVVPKEFDKLFTTIETINLN